jgi:dihydroxy-acid dehydratase
MKQLQPMMDTDVMTVTGSTLASNLEGFKVKDEDVIRPMSNPIATRPAIMVLRGNLAPETGIVKTGILERKVRRFSGPAICFTTSDAALEAIQRGDVKPGHVVVMRGAGACGGPAMGGGASRVVFGIDGAGLGDQVAMLTDGHLSGLVCKGLVVAEVSPEAAVGGPLAMVENGDQISIDLDKRLVDLDVPAEIIQERNERWAPTRPLHDSAGWLQIYRARVGKTAQGAVLTRHP